MRSETGRRELKQSYDFGMFQTMIMRVGTIRCSQRDFKVRNKLKVLNSIIFQKKTFRLQGLPKSEMFSNIYVRIEFST